MFNFYDCFLRKDGGSIKEGEDKMNALEKWVIEDMINRLDGVEDLEGYVADLSFLLYEEDNYSGVIDGYMYYEDAKEWIRTFWDDLRDEVENFFINSGEQLNPFDNECAFMVNVIINAASRLISKSAWVNKHWDEEVTYTEDIIKQIKTELEEAIA